MTLNEVLRMPASDAALMLYRRHPTKAFALLRALQELADAGSAVKPPSGWALQRAAAARPVQVAAGA
jgi:hypothetical protein